MKIIAKSKPASSKSKAAEFDKYVSRQNYQAKEQMKEEDVFNQPLNFQNIVRNQGKSKLKTQNKYQSSESSDENI